MSVPIWGRVYRLEIGDDAELLEIDGGVRPGRTGATATGPAQIRFRVAHNITGYQSLAEITVYGLGRESRQRTYDRYRRVRLVAGFEGRHGEIFNGGIYNIGIGRDGPETFVTLLCSSGLENYDRAIVNHTFGARTPLREIIEHAAQAWDLVPEFIGSFDDIPPNIRHRAVMMGARALLRELSMHYEFSWMIEGDRLVVARDGASREAQHAYSADTGMIGSPQIHETGLDVRVALDATVRPLDRITVENATGDLAFGSAHHFEYAGTIGAGEYLAHGVVHSGDYYGDDWSTIIEAFNPSIRFLDRPGYPSPSGG